MLKAPIICEYEAYNLFRKKENFCSENFLDFQSADGEEIEFCFSLYLEAKGGSMCLKYVTVIYGSGGGECEYRSRGGWEGVGDTGGGRWGGESLGNSNGVAVLQLYGTWGRAKM